jgi:hypothetical protein
VRVEDMFASYIEFRVKDEGTMSNTEVGGFQIDYSALCFNHGVDQWFRLMHNNMNAGQLRLKTEYVDDTCPRQSVEQVQEEID